MASAKTAARTSAKWVIRAALWSLVATLVVLGVGPRAGLFRTLVVRSGSMGSAMPTGSLAVVTSQNPAEVKVGQIITFHVPGADDLVVSHRVIEVDTRGGSTTFRTKGDKNQRPDPWKARVTGDTAWRVRMALPGLGWGVVAFRMPWVRLAASVVAPMLLAMLALHSIWSRPQKHADSGKSPVGANPEAAPAQPLSQAQVEWAALGRTGIGRQQQGGAA